MTSYCAACKRIAEVAIIHRPHEPRDLIQCQTCGRHWPVGAKR